jgi:hypothetical protein
VQGQRPPPRLVLHSHRALLQGMRALLPHPPLRQCARHPRRRSPRLPLPPLHLPRLPFPSTARGSVPPHPPCTLSPPPLRLTRGASSLPSRRPLQAAPRPRIRGHRPHPRDTRPRRPSMRRTRPRRDTPLDRRRSSTCSPPLLPPAPREGDLPAVHRRGCPPPLRRLSMRSWRTRGRTSRDSRALWRSSRLEDRKSGRRTALQMSP